MKMNNVHQNGDNVEVLIIMDQLVVPPEVVVFNTILIILNVFNKKKKKKREREKEREKEERIKGKKKKRKRNKK
jgi:predicted histidine transporter YuiF (NhaC family)